MMNLFYKNRGSVSVFLVIILVPIIVVCSIFIDGSRMKLAQSLAKSSADLTLNTALSYYDLELSDYYGLMASSQSQEEFMANAKTFFEGCMTSQGFSTTEAQKAADTLIAAFEGDSDIVDLLQIEVMENFSVTAVDGANLADAAMIKTGIIDFMKYRAPIELLANGDGIVAKLEEVGAREELIPVETFIQNEKQEYYEAESELLKLCGSIYLDFKEYDNGVGITEEELAGIKGYMEGLEERYKEMYIKMVKDLYNTEGCEKFLSVASRMNSMPDPGNYTDTDENTLISLISQGRTAISNYETASTTLQSKLNSLSFSTWNENYYDIQYWIQMDAAISTEYESYINALNAMLLAEQKLKKAYENRLITEDEWDYVPVYDAWGNFTIQYIQVEYASDVKDKYSGEGYATIEQSYESVMDEIEPLREGVSSQAIYTISQKLQDISTDAIDNKRVSNEDMDKELEEIANEVFAFYGALDAAIVLLTAIEGQLESIETAVAEYELQYGEWKEEVEDNATLSEKSPIISTDLHEIGVIEGTESPSDSTEEKTLQHVQINQEEVNDCLQRIGKIKELLGEYKTVIAEKYLYGGIVIFGVDSYDVFKTNSGVDETSIVINNEQLEAYAESAFAAVMTIPDSSCYPDVDEDNSPDFLVNRPKFRDWLDMQFGDSEPPLTDKNNADDVMEGIEEALEKAKENQAQEPDRSENSTNEIKGQDNLPSAGTDDGVMNNYGEDENTEDSYDSENTASVFNVEGVDFVNILEHGRDNLLALSFIMNMFSYDTYVKENKYKLVSEKYPDENITLATYSGLYAKDDIKTAWENADTTFTANKTLTNKMRNLDNNFSFGNEVEYIIYGGSISSNQLAAYGTIFGIRYVMNIAPVFSAYWNLPALISVASAISAATAGIIPVPLIKLVICLGITAAETAMDISYLKAGIPVAFFKEKENLFLAINLEGVTDTITDSVIGENPERRKPSGVEFSYSDYLTLFLFIALVIDEEGVYLRTADVIQCNMDHHDGEFTGDYLLSNAVTYYQLEADVKVRPLMLALPWSVQNGSDILDGRNWNTFHIKEIRGY